MLEREIQFQGADTVAAFIAEPIQGAGGVIVPPATYWPLVRKICDKYGVLLIADEVVTGFGRTGSMFGTRLWGVQADMWCLAKGISSGYVPLGATAIGGKVAEVFMSDKAANNPLASVYHGYTYSAHPVAAAAAIETLKILQEPVHASIGAASSVPEHVAEVGQHFQARLKKLEDKHSFVGNVRGHGLMLAIEMVSDKATKAPLAKTSDLPARLARRAYELGLMVRVSGPNMILSPPLVITMQEIDLLCDILEAVFEEIKQ
jgi:adenosylmethionine-8-amino-7-oxononanoate aminotransferase